MWEDMQTAIAHWQVTGEPHQVSGYLRPPQQHSAMLGMQATQIP